MTKQEMGILKAKAKAFDILRDELDIHGNYIEAVENLNGEYVTIDLDLNDEDSEALSKALEL